LLARLAARRRLPRIFFTNSSTEYWRGDASLIHTDAEGEKDVPLSAAVRLYHFAGTQHSAGALPLTDTNPIDGARGQQALNSVDYNPLLRAALTRMDEEGVTSELVSGKPNSLLAGSLQGISSNRSSAARQRQQKKVSNQYLTGQFPTHPNREFFTALQGI
jgi:hypothetical protein